tara:strand:- start:1087 stop:2040 length:954 start_codon:yes stop_codon:yes gene_type:complete
MKLLSLFTFFQSVFSVPLSLNSSMMNKYNEYIERYGKEFSYDNFEIFKKNLMIIENINSKNSSYMVEANMFADIEYTGTEIYVPKNDHFKNYEFTEMIVPMSVDWRKHNAVTDVKNQGKCGSCWSFSTTGSIEGLIAIKTGKLYNISEQQLIDCSSKQGNNGCKGGIMENGYKYVIENNGICSEEEYPYEAEKEQCQECKNVVKIDNYTDITPNDEKVLKRAVAQQPVSVAIQANLQSFQLYSGGVYSDPNCGDRLDHGVLIVGYGYDFFHGMEYWIVKNSWGPNWGENGYIRIQRNTDTDGGLCGIAVQPTIPLLN